MWFTEQVICSHLCATFGIAGQSSLCEGLALKISILTKLIWCFILFPDRVTNQCMLCCTATFSFLQNNLYLVIIILYYILIYILLSFIPGIIVEFGPLWRSTEPFCFLYITLTMSFLKGKPSEANCTYLCWSGAST